MHTYILALELDDMEVGAPYKPTLHCTIVHWFTTTLSQDKILEIITPIFAHTKPLIIVSGEIAFFGDNEDTPVHLVIKRHDLSKLHVELVDALEKKGVAHIRPDFTKSGWKPHVTNQGTQEFMTGESRKIDAAYLIEATGELENGVFNVISRLEIGSETSA